MKPALRARSSLRLAGAIVAALLPLATSLAAAPWPPSAEERKDLAWLEATTRTLLDGCRVPAHDGTVLFTPDGRGNYQALWTRDFAYMVESAGHLLEPAEVEAALRYLLRGQRADGALPDRVRPDGVAVYVAGPEEHPLGEANLDNPMFMAIAVDAHLRRLERGPALERFRTWAPALERGLDWVPRSARGLVENDPARPHSPYGFTDTVAKTGELLFESLLYWQAARQMAHWYRAAGDRARAGALTARARRIEQGLPVLWDAGAGAFLAATVDCRQLDVWGNAYAVHLGVPLGPRRARIVAFLVRERDRYLWHGQVRHLLDGEHWQRLLTPVPPDRYQNGAYWATATGWVMSAVAQTEPDLARRLFRELLADFRADGVCECIHQGYRQLPSYVVSAANPLGAARLLFGATSQPDSKTAQP